MSSFNVLANDESETYTNTGKFDIVKAKKNLAEKHKSEAMVMGTNDIKERCAEIDRKLQKIINDETQANIDKELENMGVYKLEIPESEENFTVNSVATDVVLYTPYIYYDAPTQHWLVTASGTWVNNNWLEGLVFLGFPGEVKNLGYEDAVGITYFNTSGTYNASVISSNGWLSNGDSSRIIQNPNPTQGDGKLGVAFQLQDKAYYDMIHGVNNPNAYLGYRFGCSIYYTNGWSSFNGYARTMYAHTYKTCYISDIKFGVTGKEFGCEVTLSTRLEGFSCFSGADATF